MTYTSFEIAEELHDVSDWPGSPGCPYYEWGGQLVSEKKKWYVPAYDAEYILTMLPMRIEAEGTIYYFELTEGLKDRWCIGYRGTDNRVCAHAVADTIANCAATMALKLFEMGYLEFSAK